MRLPILPSSKEMRLMREATTTRGVNYFHLPRPLWRKLKKCLPKNNRKMSTKGGRPRASDRAVINAIWYVLFQEVGRTSENPSQQVRELADDVCSAFGIENPVLLEE
jgi:hypothetical protein